MTEQPSLFAVKPIIKYPREAQIGKTYLMTIDLQPEEGFEWQYDEEEYPIYCQLDSNLFSSKPIGEPVVVLHRFGGSYGESKFLLTAKDQATEGEISITLMNAWGVSVKNIKVSSSLQSKQNIVSEEQSIDLEEVLDKITRNQAQISDTSVADTLIEIIRQQLAVLHSLNMSEWENNLHQLEEQALSERFRVLFLGEFKRGKSTLINALLAREVNYEVLATSVLPTTGVITEIKWGDTPHVRVHYSDEHSVLASIERLKDYVSINHNNSLADAGICERIEVFLPVSFLKSGLEIIDSPGLNDTELRQRATLNYLTRSDLTLFVLSALSPLSQSELEIIKLITNINKDIVFVCNQFDRVPDEDKDRFKNYIINRLIRLSNDEKRKVFFVSAYEALRGRLDKDSNQFQKSGIFLLEETFYELIVSRKELKFRRISAVVKEAIRESRHTISSQSSLLQSEQEDLDAQYRSEQASLGRINEVRSRLDRRISRSCEETMNLVSTKASQFFNQVAKQIDNWADEYKVREPLTLKDFLPWNNTSSVGRVASEVVEHLISKMDVEFRQWQGTELHPSVMQCLASIANDLESISHELSAIHIELKSQPEPNRIIFLAEGTLSQATIVRQTLLATVSAAVLLRAPVELLIPTLIGTLVRMKSTTTEKIKRVVSSHLKDEILSSAYERSQQLAVAVANTVDTEVRASVSQTFHREFEYLYEEIASLRQVRERGRLQFEESKLYLRQFEAQLNSIEQQLDELELCFPEPGSVSRDLNE